jgi:hypothetical protein
VKPVISVLMNTPFTKYMFNKSGQYLLLNNTFIARFKYKGPVTMAQFKKELIKNHTVEEYLGLLNHPDYSQRKAPLEILKDKNPTWYKNLKAAWMDKHC